MTDTPTDPHVPFIDQAAGLLDHSLAHAAALCQRHGLPMSDAWPIAETLNELAAELAAGQAHEELVEAAGKASTDPLLGRFLGGMQ
jgi:hypothetical protein